MTREYVHIVNCIPLRLTGIKSLLQCYSLSVDVFNGVLQKAFIRENYVSILFLLFFLPPILPLAAGETTRLSSFNRNR